MKLFGWMYERVLEGAKHRHAPKYLGALSVAESSFFPVPVDVMLAPMVMAKPKSWWRLATLTTVASVFGGVIGYFIGMYALELVSPLLEGKTEQFDQIKDWFSIYGVLVVFVAGFSPIPYKLVTITAGALSMALLPFILASLIGRGMRFFLVAGLSAWGGKALESKIRQYVETLGWITVVLVVMLIAYLKLVP